MTIRLCLGPKRGEACPLKKWIPNYGRRRCKECSKVVRPVKIKVRPPIISEMRQLVEKIKLRNVLGALLLLLAVNLQAYDFRGKVVGVSDGDTIKVLDGSKVLHKIRLYGIDAPEKTQAYGTRAKWFLSSKVFGKEVTVRVVNKDRYGREVASVFYQNEPSVNLEMIDEGYAWAYTDYIKGRDNKELFLSYQNRAKGARKGLWADSKMPTPPWDYRKAKKKR